MVKAKGTSTITTESDLALRFEAATQSHSDLESIRHSHFIAKFSLNLVVSVVISLVANVLAA